MLWMWPMLATAAWAGGPRFVAGTTFCCYASGNWQSWYTSPQYFTDPGDLAGNVSHAQADAMVAAAAKLWNVPTAWITLSQGGTLAEHVSSANTYFDGTQVVFPPDVMAANYAAIQIAVIYDRDGSVTDTILGAGASSPSGCRQTGVTESVDSFASSGQILHAVIVLNGRCVGTTTQQLTQMQYQLTRVFGRVLGLAWSQVNDNVFTGAPTPTAVQMQYWPLMHPMDIVCGPYTYLCEQNAFALRADDLSALGLLYPVGSVSGGKTPTLANGAPMVGWVSFPNGQGMELANVVVRLSPSVWGTWEAWETVSGLSGILYQQNGGNPVTGAETDGENVGTTFPGSEGRFNIGLIPMTAQWNGMGATTEAINPLYWGEYSLGPYERPPVTISGPAQSALEPFAAAGQTYAEWITMSGAPASCGAGGNGSPGAAMSADASGWWKSVLCPTGFSSWWTATVKANRTYTIETTALDETGAATLGKLQPVIGVWDVTGQIGAEGTPMNSLALGMTQLQMPSGAADDALLVGIADMYGAGRPDFAYQARLLYADAVTPAVLGTAGGQITITGMGFRSGNKVTVNGVNATVVSTTATQIVAVTPTMMAAGATAGTSVDVGVVDASTSGSTVMQGALVYGGSGIDGIQVVTAPAALETSVVASVPFNVKVVSADGVTAVKGAQVQFGVASGSVVMGCGTSCVATTDANGLAQTTLTGGAAGTVVVSATELSGGATVKVTLKDSDPVRSVSVAGGPTYLAAGAGAQWTLTLTATQDGALAVGTPVSWSATGAGLSVAPAVGTTGAAGTATTVASVTSIASGSTNVATGCAWVTVCANWTVYGVDASLWTVAVESGGAQTVKTGAALGTVDLLVTDGAGHPVVGATVTVFQTAYAWEGTCTAVRCASAPVLETSKVTVMSDANGLVAVTPLEVMGQPQVVQIAASTGTAGFATATLTVHP
jgi:hypothetical protein